MKISVVSLKQEIRYYSADNVIGSAYADEIYVGANDIVNGGAGRMGKMLAERCEAREDMEAFLGAKVFLQLWVKVKENWRDSEVLLRNFGFTND